MGMPSVGPKAAMSVSPVPLVWTFGHQCSANLLALLGCTGFSSDMPRFPGGLYLQGIGASCLVCLPPGSFPGIMRLNHKFRGLLGRAACGVCATIPGPRTFCALVNHFGGAR